MKKYIITSIVFLLSMKCYSAEWIAIGEQTELSDTNRLEIKLWEYVEKKSKSKFKPRETYRFQYKFINDSLVLINALCLQPSESENDIGTFPGPTTEELKKELYQVHDGGSCFFNVKYNVKKSRFHSLYVNGNA